MVFVRACAQCHGGPGQSTPQAPVDPLPRHLQPVSAAGRHAVTPARFAFTPCPPQLARNARTYEITLPNGTTDSPHELRSRPRAADRLRRRRRRRRTTGTSWTCPGCAGCARPRRTSTTTARPRSRRSSITTSSSSSASVANAPAGRGAAGPQHRRRALRSAADAGGAPAAARLSEDAVAAPAPTSAVRTDRAGPCAGRHRRAAAGRSAGCRRGPARS